VQSHEDDLGVAERLGTRERRLAARLERARRQRRALLFAGRQELAVGGVDGDHVVPGVAQRLRDAATGAQRDLALARVSAHEHRDLHAWGFLSMDAAAKRRTTQRW
jgi:hypothetical protein